MLFIKSCFAIMMLIDFIRVAKNIDRKQSIEVLEEMLKFLLFVIIIANRGFF